MRRPITVAIVVGSLATAACSSSSPTSEWGRITVDQVKRGSVVGILLAPIALPGAIIGDAIEPIAKADEGCNGCIVQSMQNAAASAPSPPPPPNPQPVQVARDEPTKPRDGFITTHPVVREPTVAALPAGQEPPTAVPVGPPRPPAPLPSPGNPPSASGAPQPVLSPPPGAGGTGTGTGFTPPNPANYRLGLANCVSVQAKPDPDSGTDLVFANGCGQAVYVDVADAGSTTIGANQSATMVAGTGLADFAACPSGFFPVGGNNLTWVPPEPYRCWNGAH